MMQMTLMKTLHKSFDRLRTNGKLLIPFAVSLSNHERNPSVQRVLMTMIMAVLAAPAFAQQTTTDHSAHHPAQVQQTAALTDGEVRRIDKDANKLTIRHGPIANLDMPAMSMVFQVKEPAMLDTVKTGDKIKFRAEKTGGAYTVTQIEVVK
jgi:Cu(I)/Ag(I) efflux system protein CusF